MASLKVKTRILIPNPSQLSCLTPSFPEFPSFPTIFRRLVAVFPNMVAQVGWMCKWMFLQKRTCLVIDLRRQMEKTPALNQNLITLKTSTEQRHYKSIKDPVNRNHATDNILVSIQYIPDEDQYFAHCCCLYLFEFLISKCLRFSSELRWITQVFI